MCLFRPIFLSFALLMATFAHAQQAACTTTDKKINKVLQEALNASSFEEKVRGLASLAQKYPENVQAYYYLGVLFYAKGSAEYKNNATQTEGEKNLQKSLAFFQAAIQKCPDYNPEAYYYSAKLLYNFDRKDASLTQIETFFAFDSLYPDSRDRSIQTYDEIKSELAPVYKELSFLRDVKLNPVPYEVQKVQQVKEV